MYYTEYKLHPYAICAVDYKTQDAAENAAKRGTEEYPGSICYVWDCTKGPIGTLVATYCRGKKI